MTRYVGPTIEQILRRVRQEGGLAIAPDTAVQWFSKCNQVANGVLGRVIATETFATVKQKLVYNIPADLPNVLRIISVSESTRELLHCATLDDLAAYDEDWFRAVSGTQFEAWAQLSRDLFILYPGKAAVSSVTVEYVKLLTSYTSFSGNYDDALDLPPEDVEFAMLLTEAVLLSRNRKYEAVATRIKRITEYLKQFGVRI